MPIGGGNVAAAARARRPESLLRPKLSAAPGEQRILGIGEHPIVRSGDDDDVMRLARVRAASEQILREEQRGRANGRADLDLGVTPPSAPTGAKGMPGLVPRTRRIDMISENVAHGFPPASRRRALASRAAVLASEPFPLLIRPVTAITQLYRILKSSSPRPVDHNGRHFANAATPLHRSCGRPLRADPTRTGLRLVRPRSRLPPPFVPWSIPAHWQRRRLGSQGLGWRRARAGRRDRGGDEFARAPSAIA